MRFYLNIVFKIVLLSLFLAGSVDTFSQEDPKKEKSSFSKSNSFTEKRSLSRKTSFSKDRFSKNRAFDRNADRNSNRLKGIPTPPPDDGDPVPIGEGIWFLVLGGFIYLLKYQKSKAT